MTITAFHKTIIAMGEGDVLTGLAVEGGVGCFCFYQMDEKHEPGTKVPELDGTLSVDEAGVVLVFANVSAIDRVINDLKDLKKAMIYGRKP